MQPTQAQEDFLNKHFGCVRWTYNYFLNQRIEEYKINNRQIRRFDNEKEIPTLKQTYPWLTEVGSQSLQYSVECLQKAYENFFRKCKQKVKGKKGFPRFKKLHGKQSFKIKQNIHLVENKIIFPKFLDGIKIIQHREVEGEIKFATVSKNKLGQYYVSITTEQEIKTLSTNNKKIGIDLNINANVDSNGERYENPRPAKQYKQRLKLLHQSLSRKEKKGKNRSKVQRKLAKLYLKITNKREDYLHKLSRRIIDENQVIVCEDLNIESMLAKVKPDNRKEPRWKERKRHRDIQDCGWASFLHKLAYKAKWHGREFIQVSRWFPSSQICNHCNWQYRDLPKGCKQWTCWNCWETNDRDSNSAKNILTEGLRTSAMEGIAYCPDVRPAMSGLSVG
jgi:putative transposase